MPTGVVAITKLADGVSIVKADGSVVSITSADVPPNTTVPQAQALVNNFLVARGWFSACRINSLSPLDVDIVISDKDVIPADIWTRSPRGGGNG